MPHVHWDAGLAERLGLDITKAPVCDLPTKKACDERFRQWEHGHLGQPCRKGQFSRGSDTVTVCALSPQGVNK